MGCLRFLWNVFVVAFVIFAIGNIVVLVGSLFLGG